MMNRRSPHTRIAIKETLRRADRIAADLNVLLVVIAIGLATLDATFLLTQQLVDHLPPITRISYDQPAPSPSK